MNISIAYYDKFVEIILDNTSDSSKLSSVDQYRAVFTKLRSTLIRLYATSNVSVCVVVPSAVNESSTIFKVETAISASKK